MGTFGNVNWVRNLRAAGEATLTIGRRTERVHAVELDRAQAESFFADVLGPYAGRTRLARWLLGSVLQAGDILDDPHGAAALRPVFELHPARGWCPPTDGEQHRAQPPQRQGSAKAASLR